MGITDKISGRVKKAAGDLTDDASLRNQGRTEERKGEAKEELTTRRSARTRRQKRLLTWSASRRSPRRWVEYGITRQVRPGLPRRSNPTRSPGHEGASQEGSRDKGAEDDAPDTGDGTATGNRN